MITFSEIASQYNTADLLQTITALQLVPQNHEKYDRIETAIKIACENSNQSDTLVPLEILKTAIESEFSKNHEEDHIVNLFTENAIFFGGNYTVFPGRFEGGAELLNSLLMSTFVQQNDVPLPFIEEAQSVVQLLLNLSNHIALQRDFKRNHVADDEDHAVKFPDQTALLRIKESVTISEKWLRESCLKWGVDTRAIDRIVIGRGSSYRFPSRFPLIRIDSEYMIVQPLDIVGGLVTFIWEEANKHGCYEAVLKAHHQAQWHELQNICFQMQWAPVQFELPKLSNNQQFQDGLYFFDLNKIVHVCFVKTGQKYRNDDYSESEVRRPSKEAQDLYHTLLSRRKEIVSLLNEISELKRCKFLTQYVVSEVGFPQYFTMPGPTKTRPMLWFRLIELKRIVQFEDSDPLLLWKFAKHYAEVSQHCEIMVVGGMLDTYAYYKANQYSLWSKSKERPPRLGILPGCSGPYCASAILKQDEHLAPFEIEEGTAHRLVRRYFEYAPFYKLSHEYVPSGLFLGEFPFPVWFTCQLEAPHSLTNMHFEMFAMWFWKLGPFLKKYFRADSYEKPLTVDLVFDRFVEYLRPREVEFVDLDKLNLIVDGKYPRLRVVIPVEITHWYSHGDNAAERYVMTKVLQKLVPEGATEAVSRELGILIDDVIPLGPIKMATILANANNLQLERMALPAYRPVQLADLTFIQDNITRTFGIDADGARRLLNSKNGKQKLTGNISQAVYHKLVKQLSKFDIFGLLPILLSMNEACVQKRAARALDIPSRVMSLGTTEQEILKLTVEEQERAKTGLALRCLIELIVARNKYSGKILPGFDEVDQLVALTSEMIAWATLSDSITLELQDPSIEVADSGRVEVDYSPLNSHLLPFNHARNENEVNQHIRRYAPLFSVPESGDDNELPPELIEANEAFKLDWGIELMRVHDLIIDLVELARSHKKSLVGIEEDLLIEKLLTSKFKWTRDEILSGLNSLSLISDWSIGLPPSGYPKHESYPWYYRRDLSFVRRPLVRIRDKNECIYFWSYRHLFATFDNILILLFEGSLWAPKGSRIANLVEKFGREKGKRFRNDVAEWLTNETKLQVIPYEVKIAPNEKLAASKDIGDIDVFAVDHEVEIIYSLECKDTVDSRSVHEMKTEMDKYLGRDGKDGLIRKHVVRHDWLIANRQKLNLILPNISGYTIKSIIVTAEEMPLPYFKRHETTLPFVSAERLKNEGVKVLRSVK